jgi:hypothetical protein
MLPQWKSSMRPELESMAQRGGSRLDWHALMHPEDRDATVASIEAHRLGTTLVYECESRLRHSNGQWVWISSRGRVVEWHADGKPVRKTGVGRDIPCGDAVAAGPHWAHPPAQRLLQVIHRRDDASGPRACRVDARGQGTFTCLTWTGSR